MKKMSLIFGFAAFVGAALFFAGCDNEPKIEYKDRDKLVNYEVVVENEEELLGAFASYSRIAFNPDPALAFKFSDGFEIPAANTVGIFSDAEIETGKKLKVSGTVNVEVGGLLTLTGTIEGDGTVSVKVGGSLDTAGLTKIPDLGTKTIIAGGTLNVGTVADITELKTLFGKISSGELNITTPSATLKPTEVANISGITANKRLTIEANGAETSTSLTIPAGLTLTTTGTLDTVATLTVNGKLTASAATGKADGIAITVGKNATLSLATIAKLKASTVEDGGTLQATVTAFDTDAKLKVNAGGRVNEITFVGATNITALAADAVTIDSITIADKTALTIPANKTITVTGTGTLEVNGTLSFTDSTSKLILPAGAALAAGEKGTLLGGITPAVTNVTLTVEATATAGTATKAAVTGDAATGFTVTTNATATAGTPVIGNASFAIIDAEVKALSATQATQAAAGKLIAGAGTTLILASN